MKRFLLVLSVILLGVALLNISAQAICSSDGECWNISDAPAPDIEDSQTEPDDVTFDPDDGFEDDPEPDHEDYGDDE